MRVNDSSSISTQLKGLSDLGVRLEDISAYTSVQV